jgi:hypothetical protein
VAISSEHDNEPASSIEGGIFLDHLTGCELPNKDMADHACLGLLSDVLQQTSHVYFMPHLTFLDLLTPTDSGKQYGF